MISPPTLSSLIECEWQENQCPSNAKEDKTDSIDLDPPVLGELFLLILLSRCIVYSIYYNSTLLLPVRGEGEGCCLVLTVVGENKKRYIITAKYR